MARLTEDPNDPELTHGADTERTEQAPVYLVLSEEERKAGFIRPLRTTYVHTRGAACGTATTMSRALAETYAAKPEFYGATYCVGCAMHVPVAQFDWEDGEVVGS